MFDIRPLILALLALLLAMPAQAVRQPLAAGDHLLELTHEGAPRRYLLHVPPDMPPEPRPLLVALHGVSLHLDNFRRQAALEPLAAREHFYVLYPLAMKTIGLQTWNAGTCCGLPSWRDVDDVGFVLAAMAAAEQQVPLDARRVYLVGMSNGAMMAYRLAMEAPEHFAAIGAVAGTMVTDGFQPSAPISLIHVHALHDPLVPLRGRPLFDLPSVESVVGRWREANACPATPTTQRFHQLAPDPAPEAHERRWEPCAAGTAVALWVLDGPRHVWPGADLPGWQAPMAGAEAPTINAGQIIWEFLSRFTLPPPEAAAPRQARASDANPMSGE